MGKLWAAVFLATVASIIAGSAWLDPAPAFAESPAAWQQDATGVGATANSDRKTAGLALTVRASGTPFISLQGGVRQSSGMVAGPAGIELGEIKITDALTTTLIAESADWSHSEMTFTNEISGELKIWVSRLSPAVLVHSQANSLRLFSGSLNGATISGRNVSNRTASPSYPKYVAYPSGGTIQVGSLSITDTVLSPLDSNWILVWYGGNSHFIDTLSPITYPYWNYTPYAANTRQADAPMLLVFENAPSSVRNSPEGGIDLSFPSSPGYVSVMPLLGREHPSSTDTEAWSAGLPAQIVARISFWVSHSCFYPTTVSESYSYVASTDTAVISDSVGFRTVCSGGTPFAILPPTLALAKDSLGVTFSGTITDAQLPTEFGPIMGVDNGTGYSWQVTGLRKYTDETRVVTDTGTVPADVEQELESQVQKMIDGGHFLPWMFGDKIPRHTDPGDMYFLNPADVIYHLAETVDALPTSLRSALIQYMKTERASYPPETTYNLPYTGTLRGPFGLNTYAAWQSASFFVFMKKVPLYNFYALARYYEVTQEVVPSTVITAAKVVLDQEMSERDWASFSWFRGFEEQHSAVVNANRHLAGLIGFVKLAERVGDSEAEVMGRALLAKAAVLRIAMARYPRYLYSAGVVRLPADAAWQPKYTAGNYVGYLFNYRWSGPYDDAQQVVMLNQFGSYLYDHNGYMEQGTGMRDWLLATASSLAAYRDMVPEVFRLLADDARQDAEVYANKVVAFLPQWYVPFTEGVLGSEHGLSHPMDSFEIFMAKALLKNESADALARYASFPWIEAGDLFYVHKLAEAVKAYKGVSWQ